MDLCAFLNKVSLHTRCWKPADVSQVIAASQYKLDLGKRGPTRDFHTIFILVFNCLSCLLSSALCNWDFLNTSGLREFVVNIKDKVSHSKGPVIE